MHRKTVIFIGPSAVGKTYIADRLMHDYPKKFEQAKLYTTRKPRENDPATDRIFVTQQKFQQMIDGNLFMAHGQFGGNFYGYTEETLTPKHRHILVNSWGAMTPQLLKVPNSLVIAMQAPDNWEELLVTRLENRGESLNNIEKRKRLIEDDISDLRKYRKSIEESGRFFVIEDDNTIHGSVIPYISDKLGLETTS